MSEDELLNKKLTYDKFGDIVSSAWLLAEETSKIYPDATFRRQFLQYIEDGVAGKPNKYSMDNLLGSKHDH